MIAMGDTSNFMLKTIVSDDLGIVLENQNMRIVLRNRRIKENEFLDGLLVVKTRFPRDKTCGEDVLSLRE